MKKLFLNLVVIFSITISTLFFISCEKKGGNPGTPPDNTNYAITTKTVTDIEVTKAIGGGIINGAEDLGIITKGICWGTGTNPTIENFVEYYKTGDLDFNCKMTDLKPNTQYSVRAFFVNDKGVTYGKNLTFKTLPMGNTTPSEKAPVVVTSPIRESNCGINFAKCSGNVVSDNGFTVTARGICWSTNPDPTVYHEKTIDGDGAGNFMGTITGLKPNTKYYYRAYATNKEGTGYGNTYSFTTFGGWVVKFKVVEPDLTTAVSGATVKVYCDYYYNRVVTFETNSLGMVEVLVHRETYYDDIYYEISKDGYVRESGYMSTIIPNEIEAILIPYYYLTNWDYEYLYKGDLSDEIGVKVDDYNSNLKLFKISTTSNCHGWVFIPSSEDIDNIKTKYDLERIYNAGNVISKYDVYNSGIYFVSKLDDKYVLVYIANNEYGDLRLRYKSAYRNT